MTETERLIIKPLNHNQLLKYLANDHSLEAELGLSETKRTISPELEEALEKAIVPEVAKNENNYEFFTLWTIIAKNENRMIGDLCFMGLPNAEGAIEIGYGTHEQFRGKGYMSEAVGAMIEWVKQQPEVKAIVASTNKTNIASYTILQKNQFVQVDESDELYHWKRTF